MKSKAKQRKMRCRDRKSTCACKPTAPFPPFSTQMASDADIAVLVLNYLKIGDFPETYKSFKKESARITGQVTTGTLKKFKSLKIVLSEYLRLKKKEVSRLNFLQTLPEGSVQNHAEKMWSLLTDYTMLCSKNNTGQDSKGIFHMTHSYIPDDRSKKSRKRKKRPKRVGPTSKQPESSSSMTLNQVNASTSPQPDPIPDFISRLIKSDLPEKLAKVVNEHPPDMQPLAEPRNDIIDFDKILYGLQPSTVQGLESLSQILNESNEKIVGDLPPNASLAVPVREISSSVYNEPNSSSQTAKASLGSLKDAADIRDKESIPNPPQDPKVSTTHVQHTDNENKNRFAEDEKEKRPLSSQPISIEKTDGNNDEKKDDDKEDELNDIDISDHPSDGDDGGTGEDIEIPSDDDFLNDVDYDGDPAD
mmetsp:Transcript_188/g.293  ORF Transcript_188/g.293 Transcript_188/m.293 type:complete len:419 (-) Transcript_188:77-1333(-)